MLGGAKKCLNERLIWATCPRSANARLLSSASLTIFIERGDNNGRWHLGLALASGAQRI